MQDADFPTCRGKIRINSDAVRTCEAPRGLDMHRDNNTA
jgi:hypothetical protein